MSNVAVTVTNTLCNCNYNKPILPSYSSTIAPGAFVTTYIHNSLLTAKSFPAFEQGFVTVARCLPE